MSTKITLKQLGDDILELFKQNIVEYSQNTEYKKDTLVYCGDLFGRTATDFISDNTQESIQNSFTLDKNNDKIVLIGGNGVKFAIKIVDSIEDVTEENIIYLIPNDAEEDSNIYNEYILINSIPELIGNTKIDLTGYATEDYVNEAISNIPSTDLPIATSEDLGGVKIGDNIDISEDGTISVTFPEITNYDLPIASETQLGGIKVGEGLEIDAEGILRAIASGEIPVAQYTEDTEYKEGTLVYYGKYIAIVEKTFTTSNISSNLNECWEDDIKLENITVMNTDHMHLMVEYGQDNFYEKDILVYLNELICRVVNDFTADNTLGNSIEDSFNADIGAGHLVLLNKEADHNIVEYKKGTYYEKDKLVWGDGRICRVLSNYTSNTNTSYTLAQAIKRDMEKGYLEELGEKYKFKLYKTTMDLDKTIDSINEIPISTIVFEDVDDIDIMRLNEGIYGPLGTLALIKEIDKNNQIIKAKTVNSREMEFMPPAPDTIRFTIVT